MNKIKESCKKITAFLLAFLLSFITIIPSLKAETGTSSWIPGYYYKVSGGTYGQMDRLEIDGEDVFCLDPEHIFKAGAGFSKGNIKEILSEENLKEIEFIHHFGYILNGKGDRNRAFTQVAIWESLGYSVRVGSSNGSNDRRGDYESWLSSVKAKINAFQSVPSWNGTTVKGKIGDIITLDGENKINGSHVVDSAGSSVWAEDGKIKIKITENSQNKKIILKKLPQGYDESGVTLLYKKSGSQKVGKITTAPDPKYYNVNLEVTKEPMKVRLKKVDESGNVIPNTIFEMCYSEDFKSTQVYEYKTRNDGYTDFDDWNLGGKKVYVREKFVPAPYIKSDEVKSFVVEHGKKIELSFTNKKAKGEIRIKKEDKENKKPLANVEFKLYKNSVSNDNFLSNHKTDEKGEIIISNLELGKYILREVKTIDGYFLDENTRDTEFNLTYKNQTTSKVISDKKITNTRQKASLVLSKEADLFKGYADKQVSLMGKTYTTKVPIFEKGYLSGVKFQLIKNGNVVREFTTTNAPTKLENLELGSYILKEVATVDGYVLDKQEYAINFEYKGQNVAVNLQSKNLFNKRQKANFEFTKEFEKSKYFENKKEAVIGLFTSKDQNGIKANTLINVVHITKEKLSGSFDNIIAGDYYLKELDTSNAFNLNQNQYKLSFKYSNKNSENTTIKLAETFINELKRGNVEIIKLDAKTKKVLPGAKFGLYTSNNKKIGSYTTDENGKIVVKDLEIGEYYFIEEYAPKGFIINKTPLKFKVETNGKTHYTTVENERIPHKVEITKTDLTTGKAVEGATIEIYDKETGKKVYETVTDKDGKLPGLKLPFGNYYFVETKAPKGYLLNNKKQFFTVEKDGKITGQTNLENEMITSEVILTKKDTMNLKNVAGATVEFENVKTKEKKTAVTDANGKIRIKLTYGEWIYKETIAPVGYVKAEKYGKINVTEHGAKILEVLWNQPITSDYILTKQDTISKKALPNCEVKIVNAETGEEVFRGKTDQNGKIKVKLRYGTYILEETIAPVGYIKANKTLKFNVTENGATIEQVLYNDKIQLMPKTNLYSSSTIFSTLLLISGLGAGFVLLKIKKQEEN